MKRIKVIICALLICISAAPAWHVPRAYAQTQTVSATVTFRVVSAADYQGLKGARVIVVDSSGRVITSGLTNSNGVWSVPLTVNSDPRFDGLGVVTAICVANGYNENVVFEVPVRQGTVQPITLYPVKPKLRNEASASLGQLHHLDVIEIVNKYASQMGLERQPGLSGESGYAPWGPNLKRAE
ncbi:hypothetical protein NZD89_05275 [Alicyclobacillus fastidiosus]|uniref:Bacterial Ig domain-containing protein n=1 Tax=Alicyclobacillus fastidiosus TaxID=392011 RepID=A0ABY6ZJ30_9BACL|nr:hypothetical protein [Alicyclobacillus fastidiosus]WAH42841.1 hypothetical protein NZD89_05275 [Alicyclobacillus fastidiosus]GMA64773.1 hypothetical protein GCM10025859_52130 [Alicyclobacillus fastidiosus]